MSGLILPLPEPPDEDAHRLQTQLRIARASLQTAEERRDKVDEWRADPHLTWPDDMTLRILAQVRDLEVALWTREVAQLEQTARAIGLQP